jgi:hypothetical protein
VTGPDITAFVLVSKEIEFECSEIIIKSLITIFSILKENKSKQVP